MKKVIFDIEESLTVNFNSLPATSPDKFYAMKDMDTGKVYIMVNTIEGYTFTSIDSNNFWGGCNITFTDIIEEYNNEFGSQLEFFQFDTAKERLEWFLKEI